MSSNYPLHKEEYHIMFLCVRVCGVWMGYGSRSHVLLSIRLLRQLCNAICIFFSWQYGNMLTIAQTALRKPCLFMSGVFHQQNHHHAFNQGTMLDDILQFNKQQLCPCGCWIQNQAITTCHSSTTSWGQILDKSCEVGSSWRQCNSISHLITPPIPACHLLDKWWLTESVQ